MKKFSILSTSFIFFGVSLFFFNTEILAQKYVIDAGYGSKDSGTFTDNRDGKTYRYIKIGTQTWMAENLNYTTGNSWCNQCETYGRLYDWETAKNACPSGWHLPSDNEWKQLEIYLGMSSSNVDKTGCRGDGVSNKLKNSSGWNENGSGNNSSGFTALPAGDRILSDGSFYDLGLSAFFWSSTPGGSERAWGRYLYYYSGEVYRYCGHTAYGFSVRCIKD